MKTLGTLFVDEPHDALKAWLDDRLDEPVWGLQRTGDDREEGDVWFVASLSGNALAAATDDGRWWQDVPLVGDLHIDKKLTRRVFELDGDEIFAAGRLGSRGLSRLAELAFEPRRDGLFEAALEHIERGRWEGADALLQACDTTLSPADRELEIAYLNRAQNIRIRRAQCAMELDHEGEAVALLAEVSEERPGDDLLEATQPMQTEGWLLTLALAHEEAAHPAEAATVYAKLIEEKPDQDLFVLSQARALRRAGDLDSAADAYDRFVQRRASDDLSLVLRHSPDADLLDADPDLLAACLESGELLEERGLHAAAADRYVTLIRHAPFAREGYARLFRLSDFLEGDALTVTIAGEVLRLLQPSLAADVEGRPPRHLPFDLPRSYERLDDTQHDDQIVHAGEKASSTVAQRWLGVLTRDERDTRDIERHARQVDGSKHPQLLETVRAVAEMLGVKEPRLFLSFGSRGVDVLGSDDPFLLLGACHLDPEDDRYLQLRHLTFAVASQIEHIRADHVILTSSEFWKSFGIKSATTLLAFVPLGDIVGKIADTKALKWVKKFKGSAETKVTRKLLDIAEARLNDESTKDSVQSAYTAALAKFRQVTLEDESEHEPTMMKERLADFARAAMYTADRVGLLACDDLATCVDAMIRMSPTHSDYASELDTEGLLPLLAELDDDGKPKHEEFAMRVGELFKFALSEDYVELRRAIDCSESKEEE